MAGSILVRLSLKQLRLRPFRLEGCNCNCVQHFKSRSRSCISELTRARGRPKGLLLRDGRLGFHFWPLLVCGCDPLVLPSTRQNPSHGHLLLPFVPIQKLPRRGKKIATAVTRGGESERECLCSAWRTRSERSPYFRRQPPLAAEQANPYPFRPGGQGSPSPRSARRSRPPRPPCPPPRPARLSSRTTSSPSPRWGILGYFLLLGTWLQRFGGCYPEQSDANSAVVFRCPSVWLGWGLGSRSCREFWIFPVLSV